MDDDAEPGGDGDGDDARGVHAGARDDDEAEGEETEADGAETVDEARAKIERGRNALRNIQQCGYKLGDGPYDAAQHDIDEHIAKLQEMRPETARPSAALLRRAREALDKAERAREALAGRLDEITKRFYDDLDVLSKQEAEMEQRVSHHRAKVARIEADIGAGRGVPQKAKDVFNEAESDFRDLASQVSKVIESMAKLPGGEQVANAEGAQLRDKFGALYDKLHSVSESIMGTEGAVEGDADADSDTSGDTDDEADDDDDDAEIEPTDDAELLEDVNGQARGGGAAPPKLVRPKPPQPTQQDMQEQQLQVEAGNGAAAAAAATVVGAAAAKNDQEPRQEQAAPARTSKSQSLAAGIRADIAKAERKVRATVRKAKEGRAKEKPMAAGGTKPARCQVGAGGATEPYPGAMVDTSAAAQEQAPIPTEQGEV